MNFGLKESTLDKIIECLSSFPQVKRAQIYGSRAKGDFKAYSDIDIALWGNLGPLDAGRVRAELEELPTLYKFDVLHYDTLDHENLRKHIDRVGKDLFVRGLA